MDLFSIALLLAKTSSYCCYLLKRFMFENYINCLYCCLYWGTGNNIAAKLIVGRRRRVGASEGRPLINLRYVFSTKEQLEINLHLH